LVVKQFIITQKKFERRIKTELQHKLRVVMNCYTISDFQLNEINNTFTFRKNYRINGKRLEDKKTLTGSYLAEAVPEEEQYKITITVNT
jgi:hypothetical protein